MKGQLSEDVAGNLQVALDDLKEDITKRINGIQASLGDADISEIGDGTVTGAISSLNDALAKEVLSLNSNLEQTNGDLTATDGTSFRFGVTEDGEYGYITTGEDGADTVNPFKRSNDTYFSKIKEIVISYAGNGEHAIIGAYKNDAGELQWYCQSGASYTPNTNGKYIGLNWANGLTYCTAMISSKFRYITLKDYTSISEDDEIVVEAGNFIYKKTAVKAIICMALED
jgi:hypothetical protein